MTKLTADSPAAIGSSSGSASLRIAHSAPWTTRKPPSASAPAATGVHGSERYSARCTVASPRAPSSAAPTSSLRSRALAAPVHASAARAATDGSGGGASAVVSTALGAADQVAEERLRVLGAARREPLLQAAAVRRGDLRDGHRRGAEHGEQRHAKNARRDALHHGDAIAAHAEEVGVLEPVHPSPHRDEAGQREGRGQPGDTAHPAGTQPDD